MLFSSTTLEISFICDEYVFLSAGYPPGKNSISPVTTVNGPVLDRLSAQVFENALYNT
jgi:hypothetical protein